MRKPRWILAPLLAALTLLASCRTGQTPNPGGGFVEDVKGIAASCGKQAAGNLLGGAITAVATDLTAANFNQVDDDIRAEVGKLVAGGVALNAAWQAIACIVRQLVGEAKTDARFADSLAARRVENGERWLERHQVIFVEDGAGDAPMQPGAQ